MVSYVTLASICDKIDYGLTESATNDNTGIKFLRITDIQNGSVQWRSVPYCKCSTQELKQYSLVTGDILFTRTGATTGKSFLVKQCPPNTVFASYLIRVKPNLKIIHPEYLFYFFQTPKYWQQITKSTVGAAQPGVNATKLSQLLIPCPSLPEQKRSAAILEKADRLRRLRRYALELSGTYLQSVFLEMFGNPDKNPKHWNLSLLSEEGILDRGKSQHRPRNAAHLYGGSYPFIQTGDVANSNGLITQYSQTYSEAGLAQSRLWKKGTLCITIAANIAKTAILGFDACFPDSIVGFIPGPRITVEYVRQWFASIQDRLEKIAPQSAQKNINLEILSNLQIPVPPLALQQKFVQIVQKYERLRTQQREAERQAEHLFQTLLHKAFQGELILDEGGGEGLDVEVNYQATAGLRRAAETVGKDAYQLALPME
jgi:type I restriction enzyme S subunit